MPKTARKIVLKLPHLLLDQPIVCRLVKEYDLEFNILKASVTPREEGLLILELSGDTDRLSEGIAYLESSGVTVQALSQDIIRNEDRCIHCGACTSVCPTAALALDRTTFKVEFDQSKCIACEHCINACPVRAMEVHY